MMNGNDLVTALVIVVMAWCAWNLWKDDGE